MFSVLALASAASALPATTTTAAPQPYVIQQASSMMVEYAVSNRNSGVPESSARSAATQIVSSALAPPQATALVLSAASYYAQSGPTIAGTQAQSLADQASSYYDALATQPGYKNYASMVHDQAKLFNVDAMSSSAQQQINQQGNAHSNNANRAVNKAQGVYTSLKADSAGSKAVATGKALMGRVANDFQIDTDKVKARVQLAKNDFVQALAN